MNGSFLPAHAAAALVVAACAAHAATFHETGDAGSALRLAQSAPIVGPLDAIAGRIDHAFDVDLFALNVADPHAFSATAVPVDAGAPHLQLFLFDVGGHGIVANSGWTFSPWPALPAGTLDGHPSGVCLLGVSPKNADPRGTFGTIFPDIVDGLSKPTGLSQIDILMDWTLDYTAIGGLYRIDLIGAKGLASPLEADFDEDGDVDGADLAVWRGGFGLVGSAIHSQGDADFDGDVDGGDYLAWQQQFMGPGVPARVDARDHGVPEPNSAALAAIAVMLVMRKRSH
jgi:hypothetical protein